MSESRLKEINNNFHFRLIRDKGGFETITKTLYERMESFSSSGAALCSLPTGRPGESLEQISVPNGMQEFIQCHSLQIHFITQT